MGGVRKKWHRGKFLNFWKSLYCKLKSCIKIQEHLTDYFECKIGTKQGCVGSPKLFSLFINDLVSYLELNCNHRIFMTKGVPDILTLTFADDVDSFSDTVVSLQRLIHHNEDFCKLVGMDIILEKTKTMIFRNDGPLKASEKIVFCWKIY